MQYAWYPPVSTGGFSFLPHDKIFLSWGVSFLEQKRAVGKWGDYFCKRNFPKRCLVLRLFDAYQLRRKIFYLLWLPFTPPYLRIYEGIFLRTTARCFSLEGDGHKRHLEKFYCRWVDFDPLKCPDMWKDFSSAEFNTAPPLADAQKHHLKWFQKFFLKLGLQKGVWKSELVKGLSKSFWARVDFYPSSLPNKWKLLSTAPWQLNTRHPGDHNREDAAPTQTSVKCRWEPRAKIYWMTASKMQCCSVFWNFNQTVR
jgi:hypothetical protein